MYKRIFAGVAGLALVFANMIPAMAAPNFIAPNDSGIVNITKALSDDTYIAGGQVTVDKDITGDLFIGAGNVEINGNVKGDITVWSGTVVIKGSVGDDVRIGGGSVIISGKVADDVIVGAGELVVDKTATIGGDLVAGSGNLTMSGKVMGNASLAFNEGTIGGLIAGFAKIRYDSLKIESGAKVGGKLSYWAASKNSQLEKIAGKSEYFVTQKKSFKGAGKVLGIVLPSIVLGALIWKYLGLVLLGLLLIKLFPNHAVKSVKIIKNNYWSALWQGFLFIVVTPILGILAAITMVGLPIAGLMALSYILIMLLAAMVGALVLGSYMVMDMEKTPAKMMGGIALGLLAYLVIGLIPIIGCLAVFVLLSMGVGGIWQMIHSSFGKKN